MGLERLFAPRSIAIFGASENPSSVSWRILNSLEAMGYDGEVYPINPRRETVLGHPCYSSVAEIPRGVDAVAFCVTRDVVDRNFTAVADHGIGAAAVFATGFADGGPEGRAAEARINAIASGADIVVVGPNGMGVLNPATSSSLYSGVIEDPVSLRGNVGVVTQSGAVAVGLLTDCRRYGFSHVVSSGNEAVTRLHEFMDYLVTDDATRVIALFIEAVRDVTSFIAALDRAAEAGKPIVVLKVGKSERAKHAVLGHTGAVAGSGEVFSALLRRHGAVEVSTPDELNEVLAACQSTRLPRGRRIAHITASGGQVNMILDAADRHGFEMPPLSDEARAMLSDETGISLDVSNPLDAWGNGDWKRNLPLALEAVGRDPNVDNVVFTSDTADGQPTRPTDYVGMLKDAAEKSDKPHFFFNTRPGLFRQMNVDTLRGTGAAVIGGLSQGLGAIDKLGVAASTPKPMPIEDGAAVPPLPAEFLRRQSISETDAKAILGAAGVACTGDYTISEPADIPNAVSHLGLPLVLKAVSDEIAHRSEHGLVTVGIEDMDTLASEYARMVGVLGSLQVSEASLVASQQVPPGVEVFVGVTHDPELGLCLAVGPGGTLVEVLGDAAIRPLPLCRGDAAGMIAETRLQRLLEGVRGSPRSDIASVIEQIERIGQIVSVWRDSLREMDINPLIALPDGQGTCVADAVIFPMAEPPEAPAPR